MKHFILCAGQGTRLQPLTNNVPKCLVSLAGKSILSYQLEAINQVHSSEVILLTGYRSKLLEDLGHKCIMNNKYDQTNMVYTLFCAIDEINQADEIIISYGDITYAPEILKQLLDSQHDITVVIDKSWKAYWQKRFENPLDDAETLRVEGGRIVEIGSKPKSFGEIEGQYIGLMKFNRQGIGNLVKYYQELRQTGYNGRDFENIYMTDILQFMIENQVNISPSFIDGKWIEIDSVDDLNAAVTKSRLKEIICED